MSQESQPTINLTYDQLQDLLVKMASAPRAPSVAEQRNLDAEAEKDKRRAALAVELGYAEMLARYNRQNNCTHSVYAQGGRRAGQFAPRGEGEWITSGQTHGDGSASIICQRCQTLWRFKPTDQERDYFINSEHGLLGYPPPPLARCINRDDFVTERPKPPRTLAEAV